MKSNILIILGGIFAVSMVGRSFMLDAEAAAPEKDSKGGKGAKMVKVIEPPAAPEPECLTGEVLESLKLRRTALDEKEQQLAEREKTLAAVEMRIEERMASIEESNKQLSDKMALLKRTASEDITHLAKMYETMKPAQASQIFNQMDPYFAAGFLREMHSDEAGLILAQMAPSKAYEISIIIASQNSDLRADMQ